jgi:thymidylate kinase
LKKGVFIAFLGPVGVGKTTTIKYLAWRLRQRRLNVITTFIKSYHGFSYIMWIFIARLVKAPRNFAPWYAIPTVLGLKKVARALATLSAYFDAMLYLPFKFLIVLLLRKIGFTIISEEYITSTFLDYLLSWRDLKAPLRIPLKILYILNLRLRPDITIFLDAEEDDILRRWSIRGYGDPQRRYVRLQRRALPYLCKVFSHNSIAIDTTHKNMEETVKIVEMMLWDILQRK